MLFYTKQFLPNGLSAILAEFYEASTEKKDQCSSFNLENEELNEAYSVNVCKLLDARNAVWLDARTAEVLQSFVSFF